MLHISHTILALTQYDVGTGLGRIPNVIKAYYAVYVADKKRNAASAVEEAMPTKKSRVQQQPTELVVDTHEVVVYESKTYRKKYYISDHETSKPRWIQLVPDSRYPSGYCYLDGQRPVEIHKVVYVQD